MGVLKWCAAVLIVSMVGFSTAVASTSPPLPISLAQEDNQPPTIEVIPDISCLPTDRLAIPLTISDPDGDDVKVDAQLESGAGVLINAVSVTELELSCEGVGTALITVSAVDGAEHTTSVTFSITVVEPNVAPTMRAVPRQECERDSTITLTLTITDQNNDVVNVEVVSRNAAVATGDISTNDVLHISCKQRGLTNLMIGMDDGQGGYTEERVEVAVGQLNNDTGNTDEQEDNTLLYGIIIVLVGLVLGAGYWVSSRE